MRGSAVRRDTKTMAPDQGGRERGETDHSVESVAAAEPARRDGKPSCQRAQYERLCRAVGVDNAISGEAHVRYVQLLLRQRSLELVLLLMVLVIACTLIHPSSCPFHRLLHPAGHHIQ